MSKDAFLTEYASALKARYAWAKDDAKFSKFMAGVRATIADNAYTWSASGDAVNDAWHAIGKKGKPTLKALRAL